MQYYPFFKLYHTQVSYTMELEAMGFDFVVLPNVFAIHMPHAPSLDIAKFRSSDNYRR